MPYHSRPYSLALGMGPTNPHLNSFFKTLIDHEVTVELKNDIQIRGTLKSVDQYLNIKLDDISVVDDIKYPHLVRFTPPSSRPATEHETEAPR